MPPPEPEPAPRRDKEQMLYPPMPANGTSAKVICIPSNAARSIQVIADESEPETEEVSDEQLEMVREVIPVQPVAPRLLTARQKSVLVRAVPDSKLGLVLEDPRNRVRSGMYVTGLVVTVFGDNMTRPRWVAIAEATRFPHSDGKVFKKEGKLKKQLRNKARNILDGAGIATSDCEQWNDIVRRFTVSRTLSDAEMELLKVEEK